MLENIFQKVQIVRFNRILAYWIRLILQQEHSISTSVWCLLSNRAFSTRISRFHNQSIYAVYDGNQTQGPELIPINARWSKRQNILNFC